jgi:hypothetical protein
MLINEAMERINKYKADALLTYPAGQIVGDLREETTVRQVVYDMLAEFSDTLDRLNGAVDR